MTGCPCGRRWSDKRECHCTVCHEHFKSISAFDHHQENTDIEATECDTEWKGVIRGTNNPQVMQEVENEFGSLWGWVKF